MTRYIVVGTGEYHLVASNYEETLDPKVGTGKQRVLGNSITISVDGKQIAEVPLPPKVVETEPTQVGSQVLGTSRYNSKPTTFTKIGYDNWVFQHEQNWKITTTSVRWRDISVWEVISPKPEPPAVEEPVGWAAVVETDCWDGCVQDTMFIKLPATDDTPSEGTWVCRNCGSDYSWGHLIKNSPEIKIVREGL